MHYARAIGAARTGDVAAARRSADEITSIRKAMPATRDYDWSGSIGAQWEAATALIAWAEGKKAEGIRLLRVAADHEDAVDKHPVTPGALLPVREMLADLLLENGAAAEALKEYEAVLKTAPRRFNATAGAAKAADRAGDKTKARAYAISFGRSQTTPRLHGRSWNGPASIWAENDQKACAGSGPITGHPEVVAGALRARWLGARTTLLLADGLAFTNVVLRSPSITGPGSRLGGD